MGGFLGCPIFWEKAQAKNSLGPKQKSQKEQAATGGQYFCFFEISEVCFI